MSKCQYGCFGTFFVYWRGRCGFSFVGGIIIPDTAKEKPQRGKVVATGKGTKDEEMILKEGDTVLYGKYAGTELEFDGTKYIMMRQSDVLAVVEE